MNLLYLDIITTILGLLYIYLEYRAHIALWVVGIIMPALDVLLYWQSGLYGDAGMAVYYTLAALYGLLMWKFGKHLNHGETKELSISHLPTRLYLPATLCMLATWGIVYYILVSFTDSNVPILDSLTNAMSIIALWALARKYVEQWLLWIGVDIICCGLYAYKNIPFKSALYGLYVIIAIMGYYKWKQMATKTYTPIKDNTQQIL